MKNSYLARRIIIITMIMAITTATATTSLFAQSVHGQNTAIKKNRLNIKNTTVKGQLKGLGNSQVQFFYNNDEKWITDTVAAQAGHFTWQANLTIPTRIGLKVDSVYYYFFATPGQIHLVGRKDDPQTYVLTGAPMQQDADTYKALTRDISRQWDSLFKLYDSASEARKTAIDQQRKELKIQSDSMVSRFIAAHPKSDYSMYLIGLENNYQDIKRLYGLLDSSAKKRVMGRQIANRLEHLSTRQIGQQMPDFTQPDSSGHPVKFSQFKSSYKYILIDFWASWCAPCRAENPNVLIAYNKYKEKGFTVMGISMDDDAGNWKKAIRKDKMPWAQLSELNGWKNKLATQLGIEFIPSNLLIDASGKIIARDLRGEDLQTKLKELMD